MMAVGRWEGEVDSQPIKVERTENPIKWSDRGGCG